MSVLVVDDDPDMLRLIEHVLRGAGYVVWTATDGREAIRRAEENVFRVIITDVNMPDMDGIEFCASLRNADTCGYTYVILLTASQDKRVMVQGIEAGADDFLTKPFYPDELLMRVRAGERLVESQTHGLAAFALVELAESRDPETGRHLERVRRYAKILAHALQENGRYPEVTASFVDLVYETTPLHDIGKVAIPDEILLKPGKLTEREFEVMKSHTWIGARTLSRALQRFPRARFLYMAHDIALTHHERWDGTGYPDGRAGEAIPLAGRIMALVDVYDALTTKRVYKPAFPHERARNIIVEGAGSHFDPLLVDLFLEREQDFVRVLELLGESDGQEARSAPPGSGSSCGCHLCLERQAEAVRHDRSKSVATPC